MPTANKAQPTNSKAQEWGWLREHWIEILILVAGLVAMNLIFIAKAFRATDTVNPAGAGQLGDFVGGYVGTFFALASVVLLTSTLRNQRRSAQVLNFEAKYFELLRLHRDNVAELEVQSVTGRKLFVVLIREFRSVVEILRRIADKHALVLSQQQLMHIAYYCLFFGTGPNSSRMLAQSLAEFPHAFVSDLVTELENPVVKQSAKDEKKLAYVPFEGHQSRLGHYYRHLYQAVRYVDQQTIDIDKYQYVKTIRAQLSNHEQALLLLNSLTPIGRSWWKQGFMEKYRMVQNIPRDFFDPKTELAVSMLFQSGYFEWEENESAI
ncbi:MAG: putative phage abortive infection protein [Dechloromonas sp.]|jgi:hypothetical protein|nr:putative phage abortive infection protein [Dechloromonas sp.]